MIFTPPHFHFAGSYVFIETSSPRQPGDIAYLISQPFDPTNSTGICLKFWHHMKGASIGTLNVYIYTGNFSSMSLLWQRKGNKGNNWMLGQTPIRSIVKYQVKTMCLQVFYAVFCFLVIQYPYQRWHQIKSGLRRIRCGSSEYLHCFNQIFTLLSLLTNRFHVAVRLFCIGSQMSSNCGKNKDVEYELQARVSLMFSPRFDVFCDLLLTRLMATWNLLVLYCGEKGKGYIYIYIPASYHLTVRGSICATLQIAKATFRPSFFFSSLSYLHTVYPQSFSTPFAENRIIAKTFPNLRWQAMANFIKNSSKWGIFSSRQELLLSRFLGFSYL